ncbi:MAG TPA: hypothetical protein VNH64_00035 [Parvularculaceae bacterium]|nr:hypothetical protein [Parvularculaceae bacterium]
MDRPPLLPGPNEVVVTATEFAKNFGYYRDRAMAGKLVKVTSHGRIVGAFLSPEMLAGFDALRGGGERSR